ncbi:MAG: FKBP-type peptidyl-prolyl cis-trans isomerase [Planctomycetaceae bacterium]|nr:FKBP-type peptidyl-prolyl cis-trans isomerase [Planctomycetaceae bacterium]
MSSLWGCETASQVTDKTDPPTPVAPAIQQVSNSEPGPRDPDAPEEFTTTSSGLRYRILREGTGDKPTSADTVRAHYRGTLDDGTEFDSSYKRGEPTSFSLLQVVAGWTEGLQYVREGGMIELEIPSDLGYGASGRPGIPPNATLHFIVELIEIE